MYECIQGEVLVLLHRLRTISLSYQWMKYTAQDGSRIMMSAFGGDLQGIKIDLQAQSLVDLGPEVLRSYYVVN